MQVRPAAQVGLDLGRAAVAGQEGAQPPLAGEMYAERGRGADGGVERRPGWPGRVASRTTSGAASAPATRRRSISSPVRATAGQWIRDAGLPSR